MYRVLYLPADAAVDRLGTVLRLLYIRDLRQLQTAIDRMVVEVQVGGWRLASGRVSGGWVQVAQWSREEGVGR
jgi:hypothetical protein